ncbi:hypothetical protein EII22_04640 [Coriobacteriales bacterium OH1046]|nr:hypothetical protein EII22_04640 [Coriobacteriales bacterium OH1046]
MSVELASIIPLAIVVAITMANIMGYLICCAVFDRASLDAVLAHGVSPAGPQTELAAVAEVESAIEEAMGENPAISVEVSAATLSVPSGSLVSLSPHLTRFTCTLHFRPWPQRLRFAGASMEAPFEIVHTRSLVVDRYRPGVVM